MSEEVENIPEKNIEEKREAISIAKRNLRLIKKIALGKNKPPLFLRVLCWISLIWGALMFIYHLFIGVVMSVAAFKMTNVDEEISVVGGKYFFTYAVLHLVAMFGVLMMWRVKKTGFYIYAVSVAMMPFLYSIMGKQLKIELALLLFSAASIGLFAINWKLFSKAKE